VLEINQIHHGDCLELMKDIDDNSVDMILCDLPYGTTACKWDIIIPFDNLWKQYKRIIKDKGAIVLTASQPFTSILVNSNIKMFKYEWIWEKSKGVGFLNAKNAPLKFHENILIFSKGVTANRSNRNMIYFPQGLIKSKRVRDYSEKDKNSVVGTRPSRINTNYTQQLEGYPKSVLRFKNHIKQLHPTQKPLLLFEYFIKTYTKEGDLVLDNCIGSGTTAVACKRTNRNFIGIEKEQKYVDIAIKRLTQETLLPLDVNTKEDGFPPTPKGMGIQPTIL